MYIALLGRQPALGIAELERSYGKVRWFSSHSALVDTDSLHFERLGGSQKAGRVVAEFASGDWRTVSQKVIRAYTAAWADVDYKITLGISAYNFPVTGRDVQHTGILLKKALKAKNVSLRLVPNDDAALLSASSHHNKLGLSANKVELLIIKGDDGSVKVAESIGAQNITQLAARDQKRPRRDAFVGMLPPKLAQMMVNLAVGELGNGNHAPENRSAAVTEQHLQPEHIEEMHGVKPLRKNSSRDGDAKTRLTILDPFCGTGVILQEALLSGYNVRGSDLQDKMIEYTRENIDWLKRTFRVHADMTSLDVADATKYSWGSKLPIDAVVAETYLGQPFSAPPSPAKLQEVQRNCNHIIGEFLTNISKQLKPGTPLCLAVPAWRSANGSFTHLPLTQNPERFGYSRVQLSTVAPSDLLYYREDQVVARELLVLVKA
ncbi:MAG: hypothetical protein JWN33_610 [Candidatus Saccharibacteria bacterium]|nr:hypothetical protein [Candidatus Saccharibacteria bacterium]